VFAGRHGRRRRFTPLVPPCQDLNPSRKAVRGRIRNKVDNESSVADAKQTLLVFPFAPPLQRATVKDMVAAPRSLSRQRRRPLMDCHVFGGGGSTGGAATNSWTLRERCPPANESGDPFRVHAAELTGCGRTAPGEVKSDVVV
jgi:hypothetical protein